MIYKLANPSIDDFYTLLMIKKRKNALEKLKSIIRGDYKNEVDIQHFLKKNLWLFGNEYSFIIENNKINSSNILDIIPRNVENYVDIIEVKLPDEKLFNYDESHKNFYPTSHLTKAIAQVQNYIFEFENKAGDSVYQSENDCLVVKPRAIILIGSNDELTIDKKKYLRILNSSYHNISIVTYQQLLSSAENMLEINNEMENSSYNEQDGAAERIPNNDTIEAIEEVKAMKKGKNYGNTYTDVDDMIKELLDWYGWWWCGFAMIKPVQIISASVIFCLHKC